MDTATTSPLLTPTSPAHAGRTPRVAVIYHGDVQRRRAATPANSKVPAVFAALAQAGMAGVPLVYHDDFRAAVRADLLGMDAALIWVNPIESGADRTHLDALLREAAAAGVFVSAHPDTILKLGTKQVLIDSQALSWSAPGTLAHRTPEALRAALAQHLADGATRVLKQYRGHSGQGIWKVEPAADAVATAIGVNGAPGATVATGTAAGALRVREAPRGSPEEILPLDAFVARCAAYFVGEGRMIDQPWQARLSEGMIRCYLVHDKVEGFGHQAVNALCPAPPAAPRAAFPATTTRLYHPPDRPEFQALKAQLESEWLPALKHLFKLGTEQLPVLWDCDFLLGPRTATGADTYVLCEINVSSVAPFPASVLAPMARAVRAQLGKTRPMHASGSLRDTTSASAPAAPAAPPAISTARRRGGVRPETGTLTKT